VRSCREATSKSSSKRPISCGAARLLRDPAEQGNVRLFSYFIEEARGSESPRGVQDVSRRGPDAWQPSLWSKSGFLDYLAGSLLVERRKKRNDQLRRDGHDRNATRWHRRDFSTQPPFARGQDE